VKPVRERNPMTEGDLERFERIVLPYLDDAYTLARYLLRDEHDAQDVVQDAALRALRYFGGYNGGDARAWLLAIVRNTGYTWLEKNRPAEIVAVEDPGAIADSEVAGYSGSDGNPEVIVLLNAQRKLVDQALEELPVAYREILVLRELEDLSYKEIARIAGVPIGTVMSRLARAREQLRRLLEIRMRKAS
jgi:RNA polymerase sigma-70 factor (ECF subfamily)